MIHMPSRSGRHCRNSYWNHLFMDSFLKTWNDAIISEIGDSSGRKREGQWLSFERLLCRCYSMG
jgi:hypothetical protein